MSASATRMRIPALTLLCVLLSCRSSPTESDALASELPIAEGASRGAASFRRVGTVGTIGDSLLIAVPARARQGEVLTVQVSLGNGQCVGPDTTVASVLNLAATIVPYQQVTAPSRAVSCPTVFFLDRRSIAFAFLQKGEARIRILVRTGPELRPSLPI